MSHPQTAVYAALQRGSDTSEWWGAWFMRQTSLMPPAWLARRVASLPHIIACVVFLDFLGVSLLVPLLPAYFSATVGLT